MKLGPDWTHGQIHVGHRTDRECLGLKGYRYGLGRPGDLVRQGASVAGLNGFPDDKGDQHPPQPSCRGSHVAHMPTLADGPVARPWAVFHPSSEGFHEIAGTGFKRAPWVFGVHNGRSARAGTLPPTPPHPPPPTPSPAAHPTEQLPVSTIAGVHQVCSIICFG